MPAGAPRGHETGHTCHGCTPLRHTRCFRPLLEHEWRKRCQEPFFGRIRACRPRVGTLFCTALLSVAVATVYGRYHYAADAVAGVLVGIAAFAVSSRILRD